MKHQYVAAAVGLTLLAGIKQGCASKSGEQVWTSKNEPVYVGRVRAGASADDQPNPARRNPDASQGNWRGAAMPEMPPPPPPLSDLEPVKTLAEYRQDALAILLKAAESDNPQLRANAIEALQPAPEKLEPVVRRGLGDDNRGVRFVAAMTVGKHKLVSLAPLLEPLLLDESQSVQAAAIYGLRKCGRQANPTPLASMLLSEDPEVKGNAAFVLGELGDTSAIQVLEYAVGRGLTRVAPARVKVVELQLAEAMVKLGAESQVVPIRAALFAPAEDAEIIALACQMCGRLKDGKAAPDLSNILRYSGPRQRPAEVRMAAAMALAQIEPTRASSDVAVAYIASPQHQLRAQAAATLGVIADPATLGYLALLLNDSHPIVQTAAAGAMLRMPNAQEQFTGG